MVTGRSWTWYPCKTASRGNGSVSTGASMAVLWPHRRIESSWIWSWRFGKSKCHPGKMLDMYGYVIYKLICICSSLYIILQSRLISTRRGFTISEKCITNEDPNVNPDFSLTFLEGMKDAVHATKKKVGPNKLSHRLHRIYFIFRSKSRLWLKMKAIFLWCTWVYIVNTLRKKHQHKQNFPTKSGLGEFSVSKVIHLKTTGSPWHFSAAFRQGSSHSCRSNLPLMQLQVKDTCCHGVVGFPG